MCGILGYVGPREAEPILLEGLRRLEYRGYDSAGLATLTGTRLHLRKRAGRVADLAEHLRGRPTPGCHGIAHTRWATHGQMARNLLRVLKLPDTISHKARQAGSSSRNSPAVRNSTGCSTGCGRSGTWM